MRADAGSGFRAGAQASAIGSGVESGNGREHVVECRCVAEDHRRHALIIATQQIDHDRDGLDCERARRGAGEVIIGAIKERTGVPHTVRSQIVISQRGAADIGGGETMQIVVVAGDALVFLTQLATALVPAPQAVDDDDLVPESAGGLDGGDIWDGQVEIADVGGDIRRDRHCSMWIERGLGAGLDAYCRLDVGALDRLHLRIPDEQGLAFAIVGVEADVAGAAGVLSQRAGHVGEQLSADVGAAGISNVIEAPPALLAGQCFEVLHGRGLLEIVTEHGDVDVLGEAANETVGLRQRRAALEQETRPPRGQPS